MRHATGMDIDVFMVIHAAMTGSSTMKRAPPLVAGIAWRPVLRPDAAAGILGDLPGDGEAEARILAETCSPGRSV